MSKVSRKSINMITLIVFNFQNVQFSNEVWDRFQIVKCICVHIYVCECVCVLDEYIFSVTQNFWEYFEAVCFLTPCHVQNGCFNLKPDHEWKLRTAKTKGKKKESILPFLGGGEPEKMANFLLPYDQINLPSLLRVRKQ